MSKQFKAGTPWGDVADFLVALAEEEYDAVYSIEKAANEQRYTFGPLYSPGAIDAHGEFTTPDALQDALWDFMDGPRELRKQHGSQVIGKVVELVQWPFAHDAQLQIPGRLAKSVPLPAGTVYAGVKWNADAWQDVKAGRMTGLSMGGTCTKVAAPDELDLIKFG